MKVAWIDDEIPKLDSQVKTLQLLGHQVFAFQRTKDFLEWLDRVDDASVDSFFVDLMMKIDEESLPRLSSISERKLLGEFDTGMLLIGAIREKFPDKPILALTVVSNPPKEVFSSDKRIRFIHKLARIKPALDAVTKLMEAK